MRFERWKPWRNQTWAYQLFLHHHDEMNSLYWAYVPAAQLAMRTAGAGVGRTVKQVFAPKGMEDRKLDPDIDKWKSSFKDYDNWTRLSVVISLASYLELFIQRVGALAIESDPGLRHRAPQASDGVHYLKSNSDYSAKGDTTLLVKGEWQNRISHFKSLFGSCPKVLESNIGDLEALRKLRNGVGHAFGRDIESYILIDVPIHVPMERVSEARLLKYLGLVHACAQGIESHLRGSVGAYECLYLYHHKCAQLPWNRRKSVFKQLTSEAFSTTPGKEYIDGLISHYDSFKL